MLNHRSVVTNPRAETLADLVDTVIDGGLVVDGDVVISLAGVDLLYLDLRLLLAPVEKLLSAQEPTQAPVDEGSGRPAQEVQHHE